MDHAHSAPEHAADDQTLTLRTEERDDAVLVTVGGEIDAFTAPLLREALDEATGRLDRRPLVVNLTDVRFLGSPGLQLLIDAVRRARPAPVRIVVDNTRPVIRPIEITGLDAVLDLYGNIGDALRG